jgi:hypothetical protein
MEEPSDVGACGKPRSDDNEKDGVGGDSPRFKKTRKLEGAAPDENKYQKSGDAVVKLRQQNDYSYDKGYAEEKKEQSLKDITHEAPPYLRSRAA